MRMLRGRGCRRLRLSYICTCNAALLLFFYTYQGSYSDIGSKQDTTSTNKHKKDSSMALYDSDFAFGLIPKVYRGSDVPGLPFNLSDEYLTQIGIPPKKFIKLTRENVANFTFVTACDSSHFEESLDSIASVQVHYPNHRLVYYDLGLSDQHLKELSMVCNLTYRKLNYQKYPLHIKDRMYQYAFKAIILLEALAEFKAVFWIDSSIRFLDNRIQTVYEKAILTGGVVQFKTFPWTSIYAVTHPSMAEYLPMDKEESIRLSQLTSGSYLTYQTEEMYWALHHWLYLCALEGTCNSHPTAVYNPCGEFTIRDQFIKCSRFDQTMWSILTSNYFKFNQSLYTLPAEGHFRITQQVSHMYDGKICKYANNQNNKEIQIPVPV